MLNIPVPYEKLLQFQDKLGITEDTLRTLEPYRDVFVGKKTEFADHLHATFLSIPEARLILDNEDNPALMLTIWAHWFEKIFSSKLDSNLYAYLWRIGLRHVEVNLDQRFSNLGFSIVRQFCHKIILTEIEHGSRISLLQAIDKILELCLLIETSAYIEATTRCDIEIIKGIADRVRNPVTVIGGSIKRLQKKVDADSAAYGVYESLLSENKRLERMVTDIKMYFELFQEDPLFQEVMLEEVIQKALEKLRTTGSFADIRIETSLSPDAARIKADPKDMECMFFHILQNGFEAADPHNPFITISSRVVTEPHHAVQIEIFNSGKPFEVTALDKLASPFYSTKPTGTGFGIPIIRLAVRKNHGKVVFRPVPEEGTKVIVSFPPAAAL